MSIRVKIIFIVLPILITALLINGIISSASARSGMTRIAMTFLGFKAQELEKYAQNQWNLLVSNNLTEEEEYVEVTKKSVAAYAGTLIRSESEIIFAVDDDLNIGASTSEVIMGLEDRVILREHVMNRTNGWVNLRLNQTDRVGHGFWFEPFGWYLVITEENDSFYREVQEITTQSYYILGGSVVISVLLLLFFTGYLTRPLRRVGAAMRNIISTNDLSSKVQVEFNDEIGELAHTFNIMTGQLDKATEQVKGHAFNAIRERQKQFQIRSVFQKYVPKHVIDAVLEAPERATEGENRVIPILFTDIRDFTTISEAFLPDELVRILNRYLELLGSIVLEHGGIIDKYIGDAIMAFFGAPERRIDDSDRSLLAALKMQEALVPFNQEMIAAGKKPFKTGIGINYGVVTVGNIGFENKMDYTIIGDMVNYASRLEGLTKMYRQDVIVSESIAKKVKGKISIRKVDKLQVKGKTEGQMVYTASLKLTKRQQDGWAYHNAAMARYHERKFKEAALYFQAVKKHIPDDYLADLFLKRCKEYAANPPGAEWDGTEILTSK